MGLDKDTIYQMDVVWPIRSGDFWPKESIFNFKTNLPLLDGQHFTGEALMQLGKQLPRLAPNSSLLYYLHKVG
jgi:alpha-galactosidase